MLAVVTVSYAIHDLKPAESQPVEDTLARQIQGTWTLVSIVNEQDGKKTDLFGPNPKGQMIMTADGHYSMIFLSANLPKFASNKRVKGTAEENQAVVQGSNSYFGRYKVVSEKEGTVSMTDEGGTFPNWDGQSWHREACDISIYLLQITTYNRLRHEVA
jgi:hypothetical protein